MLRVEHGANSAWLFGSERFTAVPTETGGCSPAILISVGCSSGMSPIFPQVDRSRTLRSEPFSFTPVSRPKRACARHGVLLGTDNPSTLRDRKRRRCCFSYLGATSLRLGPVDIPP